MEIPKRDNHCRPLARPVAVPHEGAATLPPPRTATRRGLPETQALVEDRSERVVVRLDAGRLARASLAWLGEPAREMLAVLPSTDLAGDPGRAAWRMVQQFMEELRHPERGLTESAAFAEFVMQAALSRLHNNVTARLKSSVDTPVPRHVRRAEAFMRCSADQSITMPDVAAAAGCGTATLYASFRRFRNTTPLAVLHNIRLQLVHEALRAADRGVSTGKIARRFGFTNPSRFVIAYLKAFGEHPRETRWRR